MRGVREKHESWGSFSIAKCTSRIENNTIMPCGSKILVVDFLVSTSQIGGFAESEYEKNL